MVKVDARGALLTRKDPVDFVLRPYLAEDRSAVFQIAADTAFFGGPVEMYLDDRQLFCDSFYRYYTDIENQHSWVAVVDGRVMGFIVGSLNTTAQQTAWQRTILPLTIWQFFRGDYRIGLKTLRYATELLRSVFKKEFTHCNLEIYPAHLHVNVDMQARGHGIGRHLMTTFMDHLRELEIPGVHLNTTSLNIAACRLYSSLGFDLLDRKQTNLWRDLVPQDVIENRCYGKILV